MSAAQTDKLLDGRVVLVTGDVGRAIAVRYAQEGARAIMPATTMPSERQGLWRQRGEHLHLW